MSKTKAKLCDQRRFDDEMAEMAELESRATRWRDGICYGFIWFSTLSDAERYAELEHALGWTVNGGWYDGMPLGRERSRDTADEFACTC